MLTWDNYDDELAQHPTPAIAPVQPEKTEADAGQLHPGRSPSPTASDAFIPSSTQQKQPQAAQPPAVGTQAIDVEKSAEIVLEIPTMKVVPTTPQVDSVDPVRETATVAKLDTPLAPSTDDHQRVTVDQKRMINCRADLNQLVPFKYDWAWQKYLDGCANHWMPQEINMTADIALWKSEDGLTQDERTVVKRSLGFFSTADSLVQRRSQAGRLGRIDDQYSPPSVASNHATSFRS